MRLDLGVMLWAAGLAVACCPLLAWADEAPAFDADDIVILGQRPSLSEKELQDLPALSSNGDLGPALDRLSGVETQGEGLGKAWNTLAVRGQGFRETLILLNGVRVPESFNLGSLPTESIERVQLIEGPEALAYGSGALGGVLNIITRAPQEQRLGLSLDLASFNTTQLRAQSPAFGLGPLSGALSGSWYHTDGYLPPVTSGFNNLTLPFTDEEHGDLSAALAWKSGAEQASLKAVYFRQHGSAPDADNAIAAGTGQYDLDGRQDAWGLQGQLKESHDFGDWKLESELSGDHSEVGRQNPIGADPTSGVYGPYVNDYLDDEGKLYALRGQAGDFSRLRLGLEYAQQQLDSGLYGDARTRGLATLVAGGTWGPLQALQLSLDNRLQSSSDFGAQDSPSATLSIAPISAWRWHLSAGRGTKLPDFDQLYLPETAFAALPPALAGQVAASPFAGLYAGQRGNPKLAPESSDNFELGSELQLGPLLVQLSGFCNQSENLIQSVLDGDGFWTYANLAHASFIGTEDSLKLDLGGVFLPYASFTYVNARDQDWNPIQGRLRLKAAAGFELRPEKGWSLNFDARYVDRYPQSIQLLTDLGVPAPPSDYWMLSAGADYAISGRLSGSMAMENILDAQVAALQGIPQPGRTLRAGLSWKL